MRSKQLLDAGIKPSTIANVEHDIGQLVSDEEFDRKTPWHAEQPKNPQQDFEQRTYNRLVGMRVSFSTPRSIGYTALKSLVRITCPYASGHMECAEMKRTGIDLGDQMVPGSASGTSENMRYEWRCPTCKATVSLSMPTNHGINVTPPK